MDFQQAQAAYRHYLTQYEERWITWEQLGAAVAELRVQTPDGVWWQIDIGDGGWLRWDGERWVRHQAQSAAVAPKAQSATAQSAASSHPARATSKLNLGRFAGAAAKQIAMQFAGKLILLLPVSALVGALHSFLLVFVNDGFGAGAAGPLIEPFLAVRGNYWNGVLTWALVGAAGYLVADKALAGQLGSVVRTLQGGVRTVRTAYQRLGARSLSLLIGFAGIGLLVGRILNSGMEMYAVLSNGLNSLLLAVAVVAGLGQGAVSLLRIAVGLAWRWLQQTFVGRRPPRRLDQAVFAVAMGGIGLGLTLAALVGTYLTSFAILILSGGMVAFYFIAEHNRSRAAIVASLVLLWAAAVFADGAPALADDGGWSEFRSSCYTDCGISGWLQSEGAVQALIRGLGPAAAAAVGAAVGAGLAGGIPGILGPDFPEEYFDEDFWEEYFKDEVPSHVPERSEVSDHSVVPDRAVIGDGPPLDFAPLDVPPVHPPEEDVRPPRRDTPPEHPSVPDTGPVTSPVTEAPPQTPPPDSPPDSPQDSPPVNAPPLQMETGPDGDGDRDAPTTHLDAPPDEGGADRPPYELQTAPPQKGGGVTDTGTTCLDLGSGEVSDTGEVEVADVETEVWDEGAYDDVYQDDDEAPYEYYYIDEDGNEVVIPEEDLHLYEDVEDQPEDTGEAPLDEVQEEAVDQALDEAPDQGTEDEVVEETPDEPVEGADEDVAEETKPRVSLSLSKRTLIADGQDAVVARATVSCRDPEVDLGPIAAALSIGVGGWCYVAGRRREGRAIVATIYATTPSGLADVTAQSTAVSASAAGARGASATLSVRPKVSAELWVHPAGPVTLKADGTSSVTLSAGVRTTPQVAGLEAQATAAIRFTRPSAWLTYRAGTVPGAQSVQITAAYPGGDYALAPPSGQLTIEVSAVFQDRSLHRTVAIQIEPLTKTVHTHPGSLELWLNGEADYLQAKVYLAQDQSRDLGALTDGLSLRFEGEGAQYLDCEAEPGEGGYRVFWLYAAGEAPLGTRSAAQAIVSHPTDPDVTPGTALVHVKALPEAVIRCEPASLALRPDGEHDEADLTAVVEWAEPAPGLEIGDFVEDLVLDLETDPPGWLASQEQATADAARLYTRLRALVPEGAPAGSPPAVTAVLHATVAGVEISRGIPIEVQPLGGPDITFELDKEPIRPDGQDGAWLTATLALDPPDPGQDLAELAQWLTFELHPDSQRWGNFDAGSERAQGHSKQIWLFAENNTGDPAAAPPHRLLCRVKGRLYGDAFSTDYYPILLAPLPQARIRTRFEREVNPAFASDALLPNGQDRVRLSAWIDFDAAVSDIDHAALNDTVEFSLAGQARAWLVESAETRTAPNGAPCKALRLTGRPPTGHSGGAPDAVNIEIRGTYAGRTITQTVPLKLMPVPFLSIDDQTVGLVSGGDAVEVRARVINPGGGEWAFTHAVTGEGAGLLQVREARDAAGAMGYVLIGVQMDPAGKASATCRLAIAARLGEIELEPVVVDVAIGLVGLQILSGTPIMLPLDGSSEKDILVRVTQLHNDEVITDYETMGTPPVLTVPDDVPAATRNILEAAKLQVTVVDVVETPAGGQATWRVTSRQAIPGDGTETEGALRVQARYTDAAYVKRLPVAVTTLSDIPGGTDWQLEMDHCREIIDTYVPYAQMAAFEKLIEEQGRVLGAEGLVYLRHEIWEAASAAILAQGKVWEDSAAFWDRQVTLLQWVEWAGDIAFDAVAGLYLGPYGATVTGMLKSYLISGLNAYRMGQSVEDWFYEQVKGLLLMPGEILVDPDVLEERLGVAGAYAVYITYQFIINLKVHQMSVCAAARAAVNAAAKQAISKWLRNEVQRSAKAHGYRTFDDVEIPPKPTDPAWRPDADGFPKVLVDFEAKVKRGETITLDDVVAIQKNAQHVRTLKACPDAEVRTAFNRVWDEAFLTPHNDYLVQQLRNRTGKDWSGLAPRCFEVEVIRTPGSDPAGVNTDADITITYRRNPDDPNSPRLEVPFGEAEGFSKSYIRQALPGTAAADVRVEITSSKHHEAGSVFTLYRYDPETGQRVRIDVSETEYAQLMGSDPAQLSDPQDVSMTYRIKSDLYLHEGDPTEALAQSKKAIEFYQQAFENYRNQGRDVGRIPTQMQKAMELVENAPTDWRGNAGQVDGILNDLGIQGLGDFNNKLSGLIESLKFAT